MSAIRGNISRVCYRVESVSQRRMRHEQLHDSSALYGRTRHSIKIDQRMQGGFRIVCKTDSFSITRIFKEAGEAIGREQGHEKNDRIKNDREPGSTREKPNANGNKITTSNTTSVNSLRVCLPFTCESSWPMTKSS